MLSDTHSPTPTHTDADLAALIVDSALEFAIITFDLEGFVTSWNPGAEALMGWTAAEAIGMHGRAIFTPEDRLAGAPADEMQRALKDGKAVDERWHLRKDGSRFWGSGLLLPLRPPGEGFAKLMHDRTAQRSAEARYVALSTALPGFVFVTDSDGNNTDVNELYRAFTGKTTADLTGEGWLDTVHPDDRMQIQQAWTAAVKGGHNYKARVRFRRADGEYRCFDCRGLPERDDEGRIVRWIGTCIDVDNEARAQDQLEQLNRSLEQAVTIRTAELLREAGERSKAEEALRQSQKMEAVGQLTGGVAHDFNNLLTVIRGSADLLRRRDLSDEKRRRYVDAISDTADRAAKLTAQLLAFARRQTLKPEVFDAAERTRAITDMLRSLVGGRINVELSILCDPCFVEADLNQYETALVNLTVNARDAMNGEGKLLIEIASSDGIPARRGHAASRGNFIAISVEDTGSGMGEETIGRIFEPFFTTKEVGHGTGLGLSQVYGFAKQSGGEIIVTSAEGQGSRFTLFMPHAEARSLPNEVAVASPESGTGKGCVLIVEDNELVGDFASDLLHELGYSSVWAHGADEAIKLIEQEPSRFDLVFTDVVMPGMSGLDLARTLRQRAPTLPVVLTSGYAHVLAEQGQDGFPLLKKPYSAEGLASALRKARKQR